MIKPFLLLILTTLSFSQDTLRLVADEWLPFTGSNAERGFMVDVLDSVFTSHNVVVEYEAIPWNRALALVKNGQRDAVAGLLIQEEPSLLVGKRGLGKNLNSFISLKESSFNFEKIPDLESFNLGAIEDYKYTDSLDKYISENKKNKQRITMAFGDDPIINNINKLKSGRVDVIVTTPMVFYYNLKVLKLDQKLFKETKISTVDENLYVGFSPTNAKSATYILWLDEGIERLRKSGSLQLILDKYGIKDWI